MGGRALPEGARRFHRAARVVADVDDAHHAREQRARLAEELLDLQALLELVELLDFGQGRLDGVTTATVSNAVKWATLEASSASPWSSGGALSGLASSLGVPSRPEPPGAP